MSRLFITDTACPLPPAIKFKDKEDREILAAATAGGADVRVTGDREMHGIVAVENVKILSPRQFWENLKET
jgi:predicted nucleic acid-binding protein